MQDIKKAPTQSLNSFLGVQIYIKITNKLVFCHSYLPYNYHGHNNYFNT